MLSAAELRIGNWVRYKDEDRIKPHLRGKFYCIMPDDIAALAEGNDVIEPIPLSPEILEKAGFIKESDDIFDLQWYKLGEISINEDFTLSGQQSKPLESLHQLQNLYYALTGEELIINP